MPFEKGHSLGKGRPKGSSNKSTQRIRDAYTQLVEDNLEQLKADFAELDPKDRIKLYMELSKYVIPTLKQTEMTADISHSLDNFDISQLYEGDNSET